MTDVQTTVSGLIDDFAGDSADVAWLLCDRHPGGAVAFTVIGEGEGQSGPSVRDITYDELRELSERSARALAELGVGPGDRVATLMGKGVDLVAVLVGVWRLGAVYVPLFTAFGPQAIAARLTNSGAKVVVTDAGQRAKLLPGPDMPEQRSWTTVVAGGGAVGGEHDLAALQRSAASASLPSRPQGGTRPLVHMFTSGTTGAPKGVIHPVAHVAVWQSYLEHALHVTADDVYWCAADPGWAYGLYAGIIAPLAAGRRSVLVTGNFQPDTAWTVLTRLGVTNFTAAPTAYRALRASSGPPADVRLRCASSAGEPLTPEVSEWAQRALGVRVRDHFGQTELGMPLADAWHPDLSGPAKQSSMGRALPGWRLTVLDPVEGTPVGEGVQGRIAVDVAHSPLMTFTGYQGAGDAAEKFTPDRAHYLTGDLGRVDGDGDFFFASRDDDVILMAGYRIGPFDIESVLLQHPQVAECAAIGVPDEARGEVLEVYVVPRSGTTANTTGFAEELQQWVKQRYAAHAYPRAVHFTDALPKTPSGKIQRNVLRRQRTAAEQATQDRDMKAGT
ncbi:AMP-binding protein [Streptomyces sp. BH106]|jgi:acetyl-CoA synthetase|uniref:AMP-binding protein n=1 Tax=Streptomyces sp. BH106 TaxID=3410409 RepID=UPI003CF0BE8B